MSNPRQTYETILDGLDGTPNLEYHSSAVKAQMATAAAIMAVADALRPPEVPSALDMAAVPVGSIAAEQYNREEIVLVPKRALDELFKANDGASWYPRPGERSLARRDAINALGAELGL